MTFFSVSLGIFGEKKIQKCLLSSPLRFMRPLSKSLNLIGCRGGKGVIFCINVKKIFSETVRWIKLILCIHVNDISLCINYVVYSGRIRTLVVMATYSSHRLDDNEEEWKLTVSAVSLEIFDFFSQICLLSCPL